jgi:chemotaxis protein histidine kinase CheA
MVYINTDAWDFYWDAPMTQSRANKLTDRYVREMHADATKEARKEMSSGLGKISCGVKFPPKGDVPSSYTRLRTLHEDELTPAQLGFEAWLAATFPGIMPAPPPPPVRTAAIEQHGAAAAVEQPLAIEPPPAVSNEQREAEARIAKAKVAKMEADAEKAEAEASAAKAEAEAAKERAKKAEAETLAAKAATEAAMEKARKAAAETQAAKAGTLAAQAEADAAEARRVKVAEETAKPAEGAGGAKKEEEPAAPLVRTNNHKRRRDEEEEDEAASSRLDSLSLWDSIVDTIGPMCSEIVKRVKKDP